MSPPSRIRQLHDAGVSVWLDDLSRRLLDDGVLERYVAQHRVSGVTSNPTIFASALHDRHRYDAGIDDLLANGMRDPRELYLALALGDVGDAARLLRDVHVDSGGRDGYASFECTPDVAHDSGATVRQAVRAWRRVAAPNLMVKVPATPAGMVAIEQLTASGINVNVTLIFSADQYERAARAYQRGIAARAARGESLGTVRSVASVFVSRLDARLLDVAGPGGPSDSIAIANAQAVYMRAQALFAEPAWRRLAARGAHAQRPLWASTAPKTPGFSEVAYVEALAMPDAIVTVPEKTLLAFAAVGIPGVGRPDERRASAVLADAASRGVDLRRIGVELQAAGLRAFGDAYAAALDVLCPAAIGVGS